MYECETGASRNTSDSRVTDLGILRTLAGRLAVTVKLCIEPDRLSHPLMASAVACMTYDVAGKEVKIDLARPSSVVQG